MYYIIMMFFLQSIKQGNPCKRRKWSTTDIDLMRAESAEVVAAIGIRLELEQRLMVGVVGGMFAEGRPGRRWFGLRS